MLSYFFLIIATVGFAAIAYYRPLFSLYLIAGLLPTYLIRFNLLGLPLTWLEAMIIILAVVLLIKKQVDFKQIQKDVFFWPIIAILAAATLAVIVSPDKLHALGAWKAYFVEPAVFYWLLLSIITVRRQLEGLFWALGVSVVYLALSAIVQKIFVVGVPEAFLNAAGVVDRVVSFFGYPNALGLYLGPIVVVFLGFLYYKNADSLLLYLSNAWRFWLKSSVVILGLLTIVWAQSEGALLAVIIVGWLMLVFQKKTRYWALILLVLSVIVLIANAGLRDFFLTKVLLQDWSGQVRLAIWGETWAMLKDHWFFGAGLAGYPLAIIPYHANAWMEIFPYPHNILFNFWSELGLVGVAAFLWLGIKYFWLNLKNIFAAGWSYSEKMPFDRLASFVFLMAGLEIIIHGLVDAPYFKNDLSMLCWLLVAAASLNIKLKK
ncbi:MAG: O-antigen ligase family protein [Patescibacteria group bacterium]